MKALIQKLRCLPLALPWVFALAAFGPVPMGTGAALVASLLLSAALCLPLDALARRWKGLPRALLGATGILVALLAGAFFCGSFPLARLKFLLLNFLLLYALSLALGALTFPTFGTVAVMGFTTFWYVANYYVIRFRGKPILPADPLIQKYRNVQYANLFDELDSAWFSAEG